MNNSDENHGMKTSKYNDPLTVEEELLTRSRTKKVKKVMKLLIQATVGETSITTSKRINFLLDMEEEVRWINLVQATDGGTEEVNYANA